MILLSPLKKKRSPLSLLRSRTGSREEDENQEEEEEEAGSDARAAKRKRIPSPSSSSLPPTPPPSPLSPSILDQHPPRPVAIPALIDYAEDDGSSTDDGGKEDSESHQQGEPLSPFCPIRHSTPIEGKEGLAKEIQSREERSTTFDEYYIKLSDDEETGSGKTG